MFQFSEKVEFILKIAEMCKPLGISNAVTTNKSFDGRTIEVNGRDNIFLGNCGYLGLAMDERLKKAAHEAIDNYGTFFSSSRSFAGLELNEKLESKWQEVFERPCIVSPSTTMGHFSTLPTLVSPKDLIVIDKQAHTSVHTAALVCKGQGTQMTVLKHNRMDHLEAKILDAKGKYENIWFLSDGVYSMFGDLCDAKGLYELLDKYDNLFAYIDDSHGMTWSGNKGVGAFLNEAGYYHDKLFLALSTNKAAAAGGGVLVFPNEKFKAAVKNCGSTIVFSGPQSPAALAAGYAVAEFQLTDEFKELQENLMERILFFGERANALEIPIIHQNKTPIFFIGAGTVETGLYLLVELQKQGYFVDGAGYPSVPKECAGLRVTLTTSLSFDDIENFLQILKGLLTKLEKQNRYSLVKIRKAFEPLVPQNKQKSLA